MTAAKTKIISQALMLLGHKPITTLDNADDLTVSAEQAYDLLLPAVLSQNNWRFAIQIAQLSETTENAPKPWNTVYQLPADYLKLIRLYPQTLAYDIYQSKKMYAQFSGEVFIEYVFEPDDSLLPANFRWYFVHEIAAWLALSNAEKTEYYNALEAKRKQAFAMASGTEVQNRPNFSQVNFPVLRARHRDNIISDVNID